MVAPVCAKFIYSCINFEIRSPNSLVDRIDRIEKFSLSLFFFPFFFPLFQAFHPRHPRGTVPRECFVSRFTPALLFIIVIVIIVARFQRRSTLCTLRYFSIAAVSSLVVTPLTFDAIFLKRSSPNVAIATRR